MGVDFCFVCVMLCVGDVEEVVELFGDVLQCEEEVEMFVGFCVMIVLMLVCVLVIFGEFGQVVGVFGYVFELFGQVEEYVDQVMFMIEQVKIFVCFDEYDDVILLFEFVVEIVCKVFDVVGVLIEVLYSFGQVYGGCGDECVFLLFDEVIVFVQEYDVVWFFVDVMDLCGWVFVEFGCEDEVVFVVFMVVDEFVEFGDLGFVGGFELFVVWVLVGNEWLFDVVLVYWSVIEYGVVYLFFVQVVVFEFGNVFEVLGCYGEVVEVCVGVES